MSLALLNSVLTLFIQVAYTSLVTPFTKQMQSKVSRGWILVDGFKLFVEQGVAQLRY